MPQVQKLRQVVAHHGVEWPRRACHSSLPQPLQTVSNRPFYTKPLAAVRSQTVMLRVQHAPALARYRLQLYRTGYQANDAYTAYLKLGSPRDLSPKQIAHLNALTEDRPEKQTVVASDQAGEIKVKVPMRSNDVVLIGLTPVEGR